VRVVSDADDPNLPLRRLQELGRQLDVAQKSGKKALAEVTRAKATTKRVKKTVQQIIAKTASRKVARKHKR